jgi:hypothetical protein
LRGIDDAALVEEIRKKMYDPTKEVVVGDTQAKL